MSLGWKITSFEEGWESIQKGITKLLNILDGLPEPNFTPHEHIALCTTVYNMCYRKDSYANQLHDKYKETCEEYIITKGLPSLQEKKDEPLLRELLRRRSIYKTMTKRLQKFFCHVDRHTHSGRLEETSFLSFYHLVCEDMNKEIMDAIFAMMEQNLAGEKIDQIYLINTLDFYFEYDKYVRKNKAKEEEMKCSPDVLSKKIYLISSDGDVFNVDYGMTLMLKRFDDITETVPAAGEVETFCVHKVSSKMLTMIIECLNTNRKMKHLVSYLFKDWFVEFFNVDPKTLLDLTICACYMKIESLEKLTWSKVDDLIKGKTPEEIGEIFGVVDDSNSELLEETRSLVLETPSFWKRITSRVFGFLGKSTP